MNIPIVIDKNKGKQGSLKDQLPSQAIANLRNQGTSSRQTHNVNHVHINVEVVETSMAILSLQSGKDLQNPYKEHPFHQDSLDEKTLTIVVEQDNSSKDEEEQSKAEPNPYTYKPLLPYPQALNHPRPKVNEPNDHLLEAFQKVTIITP